MSAKDRALTGALLTVGLGLWIVAGRWLVWLVAGACAVLVLAYLVEWCKALLGVRSPRVPKWRRV